MEKKRLSEYKAAAMLLGMSYDEQYHVIWTANGLTATNSQPSMFDPETMRPLYLRDVAKRFSTNRQYPPEIDDG